MAAALGAASGFDSEPSGPVLVGATAATILILVAVSTGRTAPLPFALLLLGAIYAVPAGDRELPEPVYGSTLLLTAELAYWSLDERALQRVEPGVDARRLLAILAVVVVSAPLGALVLIAAGAGLERSTALTAAGAAATVASIALLAASARFRSTGSTPS